MKRLLLLFLLLPAFTAISAQYLLNNSDYNDLHEWELYTHAFRFLENKCGEPVGPGYTIFSEWYVGNWKYPDQPESFDLCASFIIPRDSLHFHFDCKSRKIDSLLLRIDLYRDNEEFLTQLVYPLEMNGASSIHFRDTAARMMDVHIYGKSMRKEDSIRLQISDFRMYSSGTDLLAVLSRDSSFIRPEAMVPLPLACEQAEFRDKRIIGLGESIYGSQSIKEAKREMMVELCRDRNVRLICFEAGIDQVMNWDLYIQGLLPEEYENHIISEVNNSFNEAGETVRLLNELRSINRSRDPADRVHVVGLDLRIAKYLVFEYLEAYRKMVRSKEFLVPELLRMDSLHYDQLGIPETSILHTGKNKTPDTKYRWLPIPAGRQVSNLADAIEHNRRLKRLMPANDYRFLREGILMDIPSVYDAFRCDSIRAGKDGYMWQILQLAISCYAPGETDRVVIDAHSIHLSRIHNPHSIDSLYSRKNLGVCISDAYGDDFWTVSFHVGKGKYKTRMMDGVKESELQRPPRGSFEWTAGQEPLLRKIYCRSSALEGVTSFRSISSIAVENQFMIQWKDPFDGYNISSIARKNQFLTLSKDRFDGYVCLDQSVACYPVAYDPRPDYNRTGKMNRCLAYLRLTHKPYSSFNYNVYVDSIWNVTVQVPDIFRWKEDNSLFIMRENLSFWGACRGFFETKDKNCIVIIDNLMVSWAGRLLLDIKYPIEAEAVRGCLRARLGLKELTLQRKETYRKEIETLAAKYLTYRSDTYAHETFNADRVAETFLKMDSTNYIHFMGPYRYGEAILIEKGGATINLKCFYTEKGYRQKAKYRQAIESFVRFE